MSYVRTGATCWRNIMMCIDPLGGHGLHEWSDLCGCGSCVFKLLYCDCIQVRNNCELMLSDQWHRSSNAVDQWHRISNDQRDADIATELAKTYVRMI